MSKVERIINPVTKPKKQERRRFGLGSQDVAAGNFLRAEEFRKSHPKRRKIPRGR